MLLTLMVLALPLGAPDGPQAESPSSLFTLFRDNAKGFRTLKLQWRRDQVNTDEWTANEMAGIAALERNAADVPDQTSDEYHKIAQEIHRRRQNLTQLYAPRRMVQSFLTDRSRFLLRIAPDNWDSLHSGPDWSLPDGPMTPESLKTSYPNFAILSYSGSPVRGFFWCMPLSNGAVSAQVRRINYLHDRNFFPPLGVENIEWGSEDFWHPIDRIFHAGPQGFVTMGRETLDGHETVIIERRTKAPVEKGAAATNGKRFEIVRAWLDPKRGALPLRITWTYEDENQGNPPTKTPVGANPWKILETTEIVKVEGAGFYPTKGRVKVFGPAPSRVAIKNAPPESAAYSVVEEILTWEVAKLEANRPIDEPFTVPIPKGTYYYDEIQNATVRAGHENDNPAILPWSLCGVIVAGWMIYGGVALAKSRKSRKPLAA